MPDTPAPQLLSPERLEQICRINDALVANRPAPWQPDPLEPDRPKPPKHNQDYYREDVADLLADRVAFRLSVAEQLRGLLEPEPTEAQAHSVLAAESLTAFIHKRHNTAIHAAATTLGIELNP